MNEKEQYKIERYIQHLDIEGLRQLIRFVMADETGKQTLINMAEDWDKTYPLMEGDGSGYLEDE